MAELEETFVQQLQKVTETYKREVSEQQARQAEIEDQLTAAQGELAAAQAQAEVSRQALENLRSHPPPVGSQPDDALLLVLSAGLPAVQLPTLGHQRPKGCPIRHEKASRTAALRRPANAWSGAV